MKSILIIDPPSRCQDCPIAHEGSGPLDTWWCQVDKKDVGWKLPPEWCPLKPLPINEDDIENAERYSQLVNGIIDTILEDLKKGGNKNV